MIIEENQLQLANIFIVFRVKNIFDRVIFLNYINSWVNNSFI
jgi:hypothetical protein